MKVLKPLNYFGEIASWEFNNLIRDPDSKCDHINKNEIYQLLQDDRRIFSKILMMTFNRINMLYINTSLIDKG